MLEDDFVDDFEQQGPWECASGGSEKEDDEFDDDFFSTEVKNTYKSAQTNENDEGTEACEASGANKAGKPKFEVQKPKTQALKSARPIRKQGNSILNFNPNMEPQFTEKYTIRALELLGLKGEDLTYPTEFKINEITRNARFKNVVRDKLVREANVLIAEVKAKRQELIEADQKIDEKQEEEEEARQQKETKQQIIDANEKYHKKELSRIIIDILKMKELEKRRKAEEEKEKEYQNRLHEADMRRRAEIAEKKKKKEDKLKQLEIERKKQYEEMLKKSNEKERKIMKQIEANEKERKNNAYCQGVERDINILAAREKVKDLQFLSQQKIAERIDLNERREAAAKQRIFAEKQASQDKFMEQQIHDLFCKRNAEQMQEEKANIQLQRLYMKEEKALEQIQSQEEQKKYDIQFNAAKMKEKIEIAARNRAKQQQCIQLKDEDQAKRRAEELEQKYKFIELQRIEKRKKEEIEFQKRIEQHKREEFEHQNRVLEKIQRDEKRSQEIRQRAMEAKQKAIVQTRIKELTHQAAKDRIERKKQQNAIELQQKLETRLKSIEEIANQKKETHEQMRKQQHKYFIEREYISKELSALMERNHEISEAELEELANKYHLNFNELLAAATNHQGRKAQVPKNIDTAPV